MEKWEQVGQQWLHSPLLTEGEREELAALSPQEMQRRFAGPLTFGTAGLRGTMDCGTACVNRFTVAQAALAFGQMLLAHDGSLAQKNGVCVCRDARHNSGAFAHIAADALTSLGIPVHLFAEPRPTPQLSFAVRHIQAAGGMNITASHNSKEYNGCKLYGPAGAQLTDAQCQEVARRMASLPLLAPPPCGKASLLHILGPGIDEAYLRAVTREAHGLEALAPWLPRLRIVYTPLHGVGGLLLPRLLRSLGFTDLHCVAEQMEPNGDFPTVPSPNPEHPEAFALALREARRLEADVVIATDPDADRVAFQVRHQGEYVMLTGHQSGSLLTDYLLRARRADGTLPPGPVVIKSVVTTDLARQVAQRWGAACHDTFTGFKNMANLAQRLEEEGRGHCIIAFEEAIGCMIGSHCRDKDGLAAALVFCLLAAQCRSRGQTVIDALEDLYTACGWFQEDAFSHAYHGLDAGEQMARAMDALRRDPPAALGRCPVAAIRDYRAGKRIDPATKTEEPLSLCGADMLYYELAGGTALAVRPSGTEPKIKCYLLARGDSRAEAEAQLHELRRAAPTLLERDSH